MPIPQVEVTLVIRLLQQNTDPVPSGEVRSLQFMLAVVRGQYKPSERVLRPADGVDGLFGPKTKERVRQFQAEEGLDVDGVVGEDTWTALLNRWTTLEKV